MRSFLLALLVLAGALCASLSPVSAQGCGPSNPGCIVPTAPAGTSDNRAASTAFVASALARPWVDVRSGSNGCAAALGNNANDDQSAIQCQINFLNSTFSGGILYFPPGNYHVGSTVMVKGGVALVGAGWPSTGITVSADITVLAFDATCTSALRCAFRDLEISGYQNSAATMDMITVATNALVDATDVYMGGGQNALNTAGVDGHWVNVQIFGFGTSAGGILSTGANWYNHVKIDQNAVATAYAFKQGASPATAFENNFVNSDFSGNYTNSVVIADTNNRAITHFTNSTFSSPISITGAKTTIFTSAEIGSATLAAAGNLIIAGSTGTGSAVAPSGGTQFCAANQNVTCTDASWSAFTPSLTCGTATFTVNTARSRTSGKTTTAEIDFTITAIGSCTTPVTFTAPNTPNSGGSLTGGELANGRQATYCTAASGSTTVTCGKNANVSFAVNDHIVVYGGWENQ